MDDLEFKYLNDPNYDAFPMKERLEEVVYSLIQKNLEFEELQGNPFILQYKLLCFCKIYFVKNKIQITCLLPLQNRHTDTLDKE